MAAVKTYPKIGAKAWATLRLKAQSAPSTRFSAGAVAALLGMGSPQSASDNVVGPMRRLGLIDDEGGLLPRGNKWRVDSTYPEACSEIINELYPDDLKSLTAADGSPDRGQVLAWFNHQGFGQSNARQMAATYLLLSDPTPPEVPGPSEGGRDRASTPRSRARRIPASAAEPRQIPVVEHVDDGGDGRRSEGRSPSLHVDVQIHIPAAASAEQIDQIFSSMAKHLYK